MFGRKKKDKKVSDNVEYEHSSDVEFVDDERTFESYSFEKEYDFSVDVPIMDEDSGEYSDETDNISGQIVFSGDAEWNSSDEKYDYNIIWRESTGRFSHDGDAPDKEDEFIQDFNNYLLQQGVKQSNIW